MAVTATVRLAALLPSLGHATVPPTGRPVMNGEADPLRAEFVHVLLHRPTRPVPCLPPQLHQAASRRARRAGPGALLPRNPTDGPSHGHRATKARPPFAYPTQGAQHRAAGPSRTAARPALSRCVCLPQLIKISGGRH